jgi:hypothetical protein
MMAKLETVNVRIEGINPGLLMHRFDVVSGSDKKSKKKDITQTMDDVENYLYKTQDGIIYEPSSHIIGMLQNAGAKFQIPGRGKQTYKNLVGSGAVIVIPDAIPHEYQEYTVDRRAVVVQRQRIVRSRPLVQRWALSFQLEYEVEEIPNEVLYELLVYGGQRVGIGDFRPAKGGPFGRFIVTRFEKNAC